MEGWSSVGGFAVLQVCFEQGHKFIFFKRSYMEITHVDGQIKWAASQQGQMS